MVEQAGGATLDLGIASDEFKALEAAIVRAEDAGADVLVTLGGASVGDHDLVQSALTSRGMQLGFWRIAMRPGKPLIFGRLGRMVILGLPGNPVSSIVCGALFLAPLLRALVGDPDAAIDRTEPGVLGADVPANDMRRDYVRRRDHENGRRRFHESRPMASRIHPCSGSLPPRTACSCERRMRRRPRPEIPAVSSVSDRLR